MACSYAADAAAGAVAGAAAAAAAVAAAGTTEIHCGVIVSFNMLTMT